MKRRFLLFGIPLALLLLGLSFYTSLRKEPLGEAGGAELRRVAVAPAERSPGSVPERFAGTVIARERGAVSFTLSGRIAALMVEPGDAVEAGALLARLDEGPYRNGLEQARATLSRVEANLAQAARTLERVRSLGAAATQEELEQHQTAVRDLEARRREATAAVAEAERRLGEATLTSPYAGEVVQQLAERGEVVQPGSPVFLISGTGKRLEVKLSLPERLINNIDLQAPLGVSFPLSPAISSVEGRITSVADHGGGPGGLFDLTVALEKEASDLGVRPGLRAEVTLKSNLPANAILISAAALSSRPEGTPVVYAVVDGRVQEVPVVLLRTAGEKVLATGSIAPGTQIIVSGQNGILPGEMVEVARL